MAGLNHRDWVLCEKILKEIADIEAFTQGMSLDDFQADEKTKKAVVMSFINIGERSGAFSDDFTNENSMLPLKEIRGFRNIAAHRYEMIQSKTLWDTIQNSLPTLKEDISLIINKETGLGNG
jgi:uncharacterized protein with HEPN domain